MQSETSHLRRSNSKKIFKKKKLKLKLHFGCSIPQGAQVWRMRGGMEFEVKHFFNEKGIAQLKRGTNKKFI